VELCIGTLEDLVCGGYYNKFAKMTNRLPVNILHQITKGVRHLHLLKTVHGNLKPSNVLISYPSGDLEPMVKVADFGIRHAVRDPNAITQFRLAFTQGWMCPTDAQDPIASSFDIFPLGCLYAFTASNGIHAFGVDYVSRISNKQPMTLALTQLDGSVRSVSFLDLINRMIHFEAKERPSVSDVLAHCTFSQPPLLIASSQQTEMRIDHLISHSLAFNEPMPSTSTAFTTPLEMSTPIEHLANR